jgi:hypothetical protein
MNTAEDSSDGLGLVWRLIPALWLVVGIGGFSALSYWPQLFAEPLRTDISADAECSTLFTAISLNTGIDTPPEARAISTPLDVFHSLDESETRTQRCKRTDGH